MNSFTPQFDLAEFVSFTLMHERHYSKLLYAAKMDISCSVVGDMISSLRI